MDSTKEVVQKLAKLNIDPYVQTQPVQELDASHKTSPGQRPDLFGPAFQAGFQTQSGTQFSLSNDQQTKPEAITAPFTANTSTDPESPKNIVPLRKPFWNISRNLAESLSKGVNPRNSDDRPHTTSITKCRDRMRMGVRWLQEKERRHDSTRRATRLCRRGAFSEGMRKRLGLKLKREEANLGQLEVIKEEEEEGGEEDGEKDGEEDVKMDKDTVMAD
ncbi:hypothetical protein QR685DRAFT_573811 [Neurospora intermedia]|uniref:Uncharacterized protein n=1 Tax=Neurospora intermedia TaxID=5142 RepID=A0ABR3D782_NEUIN